MTRVYTAVGLRREVRARYGFMRGAARCADDRPVDSPRPDRDGALRERVVVRLERVRTPKETPPAEEAPSPAPGVAVAAAPSNVIPIKR